MQGWLTWSWQQYIVYACVPILVIFIIIICHGSSFKSMYLFYWNFICVVFVANGKGLVGKEFYVEKHLPALPTLGARQDAFNIYFEYDANLGIPGAFYIRNYTQAEFFLVSVTLNDIPNHDSVQFVCNSWVYNFRNYKKDRIFFSNDVSSNKTQLVFF